MSLRDIYLDSVEAVKLASSEKTAADSDAPKATHNAGWKETSLASRRASWEKGDAGRLNKSQLKGFATGGGIGAGLGGLAGLAAGKPGSKAVAAALGASLGGVIGAPVGQIAKMTGEARKMLKERGIHQSALGFSSKMTPEAKAKYLDAYRAKKSK